MNPINSSTDWNNVVKKVDEIIKDIIKLIEGIYAEIIKAPK